jgi:hypothetical protein
MIKIIWRSDYDRLKEKELEFDLMREDRNSLLDTLTAERMSRDSLKSKCYALEKDRHRLYDETVALKQLNAALTRDNHEVEQMIQDRERLKKSIHDALEYLKLNRGGRTSNNTLRAKQVLYFAVKGGSRDEQ